MYFLNAWGKLLYVINVNINNKEKYSLNLKGSNVQKSFVENGVLLLHYATYLRDHYCKISENYFTCIKNTSPRGHANNTSEDND